VSDAMLARPRTIRPGIRMNVRGRSVKLRGLRRAPVGALRWLAILGPGVISSVAGDDAGGIGTISVIGARLGYDLLWLLIILTVSLAVVQEMAARMGAATGRGLLDLVRERFGIGWALVAVGALLIGNGGVVARCKDYQVAVAPQGLTDRNLPFVQIVGIIGQEIAAQVERGRVRIVDFQPVGMPAQIVHQATGVAGQELGDDGTCGQQHPFFERLEDGAEAVP